MSWVATAVAGSAIVGGVISGNAQSDAASQAAGATRDANQAAIAEQRRQFDAMQELLKPFVDAGSSALGSQLDLSGLNGQEAQQAAITGLEESPQFQSLVQQGENALLQNSSATGGVRGGNAQSALGQFRPQMLSSLIQQRLQNLGNIASRGQNAAAGVGSAGIQTGQGIAGNLTNIGVGQSAAALAQGNQQANLFGKVIPGAIGSALGFGGQGN